MGGMTMWLTLSTPPNLRIKSKMCAPALRIMDTTQKRVQELGQSSRYTQILFSFAPLTTSGIDSNEATIPRSILIPLTRRHQDHTLTFEKGNLDWWSYYGSNLILKLSLGRTMQMVIYGSVWLLWAYQGSFLRRSIETYNPKQSDPPDPYCRRDLTA